MTLAQHLQTKGEIKVVTVFSRMPGYLSDTGEPLFQSVLAADSKSATLKTFDFMSQKYESYNASKILKCKDFAELKKNLQNFRKCGDCEICDGLNKGCERIHVFNENDYFNFLDTAGEDGLRSVLADWILN